jgi:hypothetical protein
MIFALCLFEGGQFGEYFCLPEGGMVAVRSSKEVRNWVEVDRLGGRVHLFVAEIVRLVHYYTPTELESWK